VKTARFYCKGLQNDSALNFVQFFFWTTLYFPEALHNGSQAALELATYESQVQCPTNSAIPDSNGHGNIVKLTDSFM